MATTVWSKAALSALGRKIQKLKIGYDQKRRWSWLNKKDKVIVAMRSGDCSAIAAGIVWLAGYPIDISGTVWSGNIHKLLKDAGWKIYHYTNKNAVKAGDVVVALGHHVVNALSDTEWLSAEHDEIGNSSGGQLGDQGREVVIREPYERDGGWDYICRPPADNVPDTSKDDTDQVTETTKSQVVTAAHLSAALSAVGAGSTRSSVATDVGVTKTSLDELATLCTEALAGLKINAHAVACFVATMMQESAWLRTTVEYGTKTKSYDPYRGRTFEQVTHKDNYRLFGRWAMTEGLIDDADLFVDNPKMLSELKWSFLGGLWYFNYRKLWDKAKTGNFQAVQDIVNLGHYDFLKVPAGWTTRVMAYRAFLGAFSRPTKLTLTGTLNTATRKRLQEFVGASIDGSLGAQSWFLINQWLGTGNGTTRTTSTVKALQKKLGVLEDGELGPITKKALQVFLNKHR